MADIDPSIALNANRPQPVNPLAILMQGQQYQSAQLQNQNLQKTMAAKQAVGQAVQQATNPDGSVDNNKFQSIVATNPLAAYGLQEATSTNIAQQGQQTANQTAGVNLNAAQLENAKNHLGWAYQTAIAIANNPNSNAGDVFSALGQAVQNKQITPQVASQALADMPGADAPAGALHAWAANHAAQAAGTAAQLGVVLPATGAIDTGPNVQPTATNRVTGQTSPVGQPFAKGLDPSTATSPVQVYNPTTQSPGLITRQQFINGAGAAPQGGGQPPPIPDSLQTAPTQGGQPAPLPAGPAPGAPAGFTPTGPSMGTAEANGGNVATVNSHWGQLSQDAANAQTNIGLAQNIEQYADKALTGKMGDKLAAANGLLSVFGVPGQTDLNTATDLLQKNMARLSLSSRATAGGTDAAGALASAANPHGTMTAAAIKDAAQQVIGAQQMALSEQKLLQPYKLNNDVQGYQKTLTQFNNAADPRIWQLQSMAPADQAKFVQSMPPAAAAQMLKSRQLLKGMGALQ